MKLVLKRFHRRDFTDRLLGKLYGLSVSIIEESFPHWCKHALSQDVCYAFFDDNDEPLGFHFWKIQQETMVENHCILWGGKLRLRSDIRNKGLHVLSNLKAFQDVEQELPSAQCFRVGLFNVFGFNSFVPALGDAYQTYPFTGEFQTIGLNSYVQGFCDAQGFVVHHDEQGAVDVQQTFPQGMRMPDELFWQRAHIKDYVSRCPNWKNRDLFVAWKLDQGMKDSMTSFVKERKGDQMLLP
mmetsp:Transcript_5449/g.8443  ORF Transcript_5449/g.8443 Transcript_5449/m.8443 type:complete len:240 (+) Transcript_5449:138-857(+)|eukprot:CAMPEP_0203767256 /NCGR_PEP_ID=MMETSP0099_2-20121227/890_1 /ASSEMBLY_ACC=CAM_ASM_000209 /TAXON_ID=96639 /ORGANISM=" , Strain NY0313808BC1" /LENGTH=239 /DNA_ID=CAMNT_0050663733 /DNA_START=153 /DNA_END=872 /DNA_ORIENTATION=-